MLNTRNLSPNHPLHNLLRLTRGSRSRLGFALALVLLSFTAAITPSQASAQAAGSRPAFTPRRSLGLPAPNPVTSATLSVAEKRQIRLAHPFTPIPIVTGSASFLDHYNPENKLRLVIGLNVPHLAEQQRLLAELQDPSSPNFHHYLTAAQWNSRFSPSAEDEQAVVDWLTNNGIAITHRWANRLTVDAEAPAGVLERAFAVKINHYQVGDEIVYSNDSDPVIPAQLADIVLYLGGLNNIERMHASHGRAFEQKFPDYVPGPVFAAGKAVRVDADTSALQPAIEASGAKFARQSAASGTLLDPYQDGIQPELTDGLLNPTDIFSSYGYDFNALRGQGHCCNPNGLASGAPIESTIDIVAGGDFSDTDLQGFHQLYPYLAYNYAHLYVLGGTPVDTDETTLDVEWAIATSNSLGTSKNTGQVLVYVAPDSTDRSFLTVYQAMASNGDSRILSQSYGRDEADVDPKFQASAQNFFDSMVAAGWTLIASTGDNGTDPDCIDATGVEHPASDPDFLAVGGTTLSFNNNDTFESETAWTGTTQSYSCPQNKGGTGGGCSILFGAPSYQTTPACGAGSRSVPDIALNAGAGQAVYFQGALDGFGGTSIAAPQVAGFVAQENAYLLSLGSICGANSNLACAPVGQMNQALYTQGYANTSRKIYAPHNPYYDITSGCNSNYYTTLYGLGTFCAGPGYDEVTGWGTFNALQLGWAINWYENANFWHSQGKYSAPAVNFSGPAGSNTSKIWYNAPQKVSFSITDTQPANRPAVGVAGFSYAWDTVLNDPYSEPHQGVGNSFYNGPSHTQSSGFSTQNQAGCHKLYVLAWDNTGYTGGNQVYPQFCLDFIPPTVTASSSPAPNSTGWNTSSVLVTLTATDPGANASGIAGTYFNYGSTACSPTNLPGCHDYVGLPLNFSTDGVFTYTYFTQDNADNFSTPASGTVKLDQTPPVTTASLTGTVYQSGIYSTPVYVTLNATDATSGVYGTSIKIDGANYTAYTAPVLVSSLGSHQVLYYSTDVAGNVEQFHTLKFTIDGSSTTTLTASSNPAVSGQSLVLTATVTVSSVPATSGTVTFLNGTTSLGTVPVSNGSAKLSLASLPYGNNTLIAQYTGPANVLSSTSAPLQEDYQQGATITLTSSPTTSQVGQPVTFTAKVAAIGPSRGFVTGYVQFSIGTTAYFEPLNNGEAVYTVASLPVGITEVNASFSGSLYFAPATAIPVRQVVHVASTATTVTSSANPAQILAKVQLSAKVTSPYGVPTGSVTFSNNGGALGTATLKNGVATITTASLPLGTQSITASYQGSADYGVSTSAPLSQVIQQAQTATLLLTSLNPTPYGQAIKLPVTVSNPNGGLPTGTVNLMSGTMVVATATLIDGAATFTPHGPFNSYLGPGSYTYTAVYTGSTDFLASTSEPITQTVVQASTTTSLTSSINPATVLSKVTFTATVGWAAGVAPTGTVTFHDGRIVLGTVAVSSTGVATLDAGQLTVGTHNISATYSGNSDYLSSISPVLSEVVNPL
jgi:subtilase family serine protease